MNVDCVLNWCLSYVQIGLAPKLINHITSSTIIEERVKTEINWYDKIEISQQLNLEWEKQYNLYKQAIQSAKILKEELRVRRQLTLSKIHCMEYYCLSMPQ